MKKVLSFILTVFMVLPLSGCGGGSSSSTLKDDFKDHTTEYKAIKEASDHLLYSFDDYDGNREATYKEGDAKKLSATYEYDKEDVTFFVKGKKLTKVVVEGKGDGFDAVCEAVTKMSDLDLYQDATLDTIDELLGKGCDETNVAGYLVKVKKGSYFSITVPTQDTINASTPIKVEDIELVDTKVFEEYGSYKATTMFKNNSKYVMTSIDFTYKLNNEDVSFFSTDTVKPGETSAVETLYSDNAFVLGDLKLKEVTIDYNDKKGEEKGIKYDANLKTYEFY